MSSVKSIPAHFFKFQEPATIFRMLLPSGNVDEAINFILYQRKLQEAYVGSAFALGYNEYFGKQVLFRLLSEQADHDFELKDGSQIVKFQVTEQMEIERKRDMEYKMLRKGKVMLKPYRPGWTHDECTNWIVGRIKSKIDKYYSDKPSLLVYANFHMPQLLFDQTVTKVKALKGIDTFGSIWIIVTCTPSFDQQAIGRLFPSHFGWFPFKSLE